MSFIGRTTALRRRVQTAIALALLLAVGAAPGVTAEVSPTDKEALTPIAPPDDEGVRARWRRLSITADAYSSKAVQGTIAVYGTRALAEVFSHPLANAKASMFDIGAVELLLKLAVGAPAYPLTAQAIYPADKSDAYITEPAGSRDDPVTGYAVFGEAHARPDPAAFSYMTAERVDAASGVTFGNVASKAESFDLRDGTVGGMAAIELSEVRIADVVSIDSVLSEVTMRQRRGQRPEFSSDFRIAGVTVAGVPAKITGEGIEISGTSVPMRVTANQQLKDALAAAGITDVRTVDERTDVDASGRDRIRSGAIEFVYRRDGDPPTAVPVTIGESMLAVAAVPSDVLAEATLPQQPDVTAGMLSGTGRTEALDLSDALRPTPVAPSLTDTGGGAAALPSSARQAGFDDASSSLPADVAWVWAPLVFGMLVVTAAGWSWTRGRRSVPGGSLSSAAAERAAAALWAAEGLAAAARRSAQRGA